MNKDKSHENLGYSKNTIPMRQKTLRKVEIAAKIDKNRQLNANQNKLPASIRWVSTDEPDPDFFENSNVRYERNNKALAQLAPIVGRNRHEQSDIQESTNLDSLPNKRKKHLPPLRD